jgi:hypothetical protein
VDDRCGCAYLITARQIDRLDKWAMFEIGEDYTVTMIVGDPSGWTTQEGVWKVVEINGTPIKLQNPHSTDLIVNTASWHFVSAALV